MKSFTLKFRVGPKTLAYPGFDYDKFERLEASLVATATGFRHLGPVTMLAVSDNVVAILGTWPRMQVLAPEAS